MDSILNYYNYMLKLKIDTHIGTQQRTIQYYGSYYCRRFCNNLLHANII